MKALATVYGPSLHLTCGNEFSRRKKFLESDPDYPFLKVHSSKKGVSGSHTGLLRIYTASPSSTKDKDRSSYQITYSNVKTPGNEVFSKRKSSQILYTDFQKYGPQCVSRYSEI